MWPRADIYTYTRIKQCSHASVGLAQARPNDGEIFMYTVTVFRMLSFLQGSWTYHISLIKHCSYFFFSLLGFRVAFLFRQETRRHQRRLDKVHHSIQ